LDNISLLLVTTALVLSIIFDLLILLIYSHPNVYATTNNKVLDRTAVILEIFAQHAQSREGQLQVELAMLEYRLTRGPRASGDIDSDKGCGFRGPGETKLGTRTIL